MAVFFEPIIWIWKYKKQPFCFLHYIVYIKVTIDPAFQPHSKMDRSYIHKHARKTPHYKVKIQKKNVL